MSISRWQTVSQIFEAALDLPAHERDELRARSLRAETPKSKPKSYV
jgi:hypothetical protein